MLTTEHLEALRKPFPAKDHEFLRGFTYLTEEAITSRIEEVDPAWSFEIDTPVYRGENVTIIGRLTINGVTRCNTGMQTIQYLTDYNQQTREKTYKIDSHTGQRIENGEPEKGATTDALKRCARLFGIGRYILDMPSGIKDEEALTRWLNQTYGMKPANVITHNGKQVDTTTGEILNPQPNPRRVETEPDILPTTPTTQAANVVKVSVKRTGQGESKILTLQLDNKLYLKLRTRQPFILAGWCGGAMWTADGEYPLEKPIPITIKRDATGRGWDLDTVEPAPNAFMQRGDDLPAASGQ